MLAPGDQLPHLTLTTITGDRVAYRDLWQHRNVAIVCLSDGGSRQSFAGLAGEFARVNAVCLVTRETLRLFPCPGVVIADRWGEIVHVAQEAPGAAEVMAWLEHLEQRCPECEGEAR